MIFAYAAVLSHLWYVHLGKRLVSVRALMEADRDM